MQHLFALAASVFAALGTSPSTSATQSQQDRGPAEAREEAPRSEGLSLRVEQGHAPGRAGLRLDVEGALPNRMVALEIGTLRAGRLVETRCQMLRTDAEGRASLAHWGALADGLGARVHSRAQGAGSQTTPIVALPGPGSYASSVLQRGDIVISEIMKDPVFVADSHGEWFELLNISNHAINIAGWKISDLGTNAHTLSNNGQMIVLLPGHRYVLGNDKDPLTNGGVHVDYKYANFTLGNGADSILLTSRRGDLVDQVDYDDGIFWPDQPGASLSLDLFAGDVYQNDDPVNWCAAFSSIGGGNSDTGTPFLTNDDCP